MDDQSGNFVTKWAMYHFSDAFFITWMLGVAVGSLIWVFGRRWRRVVRVVCASFGAAIFLAPSLVGGHGGIAPLPGLIALMLQPNWDVFLISFGFTWLLCAAVCTAVSLTHKSPDA